MKGTLIMSKSLLFPLIAFSFACNAAGTITNCMFSNGSMIIKDDKVSLNGLEFPLESEKLIEAHSATGNKNDSEECTAKSHVSYKGKNGELILLEFSRS